MIVGEVTNTGKVICPLCGRWTGKNARTASPPYLCPYCDVYIILLPRQERFYKEYYDEETG